MRPSFNPQSVLGLLLLGTGAYAQIVDELSFGHKQPLSNNKGATIPYWQASSSRHNLQILSDRAILTPPGKGNTRGALWAENSVNSETWTAEMEFRASGQDSGSGSLQVWYARDKTPIFIDSAYTVENFDGLVLVIDQYGGRGGSVRGFLNDGSQNFRSLSNLESLAFGHCDYSYRNLGRPSKLKLSNNNGLTVSIDDRECFSTDKVTLPSGYFFGITAATSDQPDSFEVNKFTVSTGAPALHRNSGRQDDNPEQLQRATLQKLDRFPGSPEVVPDKPADAIKSQTEQFADLHNRLQSLSHQMTNLFSEFESLSQSLDRHHKVMMYNVPSVVNDKLDTMVRRLENVERNVETVKRDVEGKDYNAHLEGISKVVSASAPRLGTFIFIVFGAQVMLAAAYVLYKRRRASMPKKYL